MGRLTKESSDDGVKNYEYDPLGQLTRVHGNGSEAYSHDATGNRTGTFIENGSNNRLLEDGVFTYTYDANGNWKRRTEKTTGKYQEYTWDHRNRLAKVVLHDASGSISQILEYRYDAWDRLIAVYDNTDGAGTVEETEFYIHDSAPGKGGLDDIVLTFDENDDVMHRYLHGPGIDQLFSDESFIDGLLWALSDRQGTIKDWVDYDEASSSTSVYNHIKYDSFGRIISQSNPGHKVTIAYTGRYLDPVTGLMWYRGRWYDPRTGRFVSQDPIGFGGGDVNLYRYVGGGPTNGMDPSGLAWIRAGGYTQEAQQLIVAGYNTQQYLTSLEVARYNELNDWWWTTQGRIDELDAAILTLQEDLGSLKQQYRDLGLEGKVEITGCFGNVYRPETFDDAIRDYGDSQANHGLQPSWSPLDIVAGVGAGLISSAGRGGATSAARRSSPSSAMGPAHNSANAARLNSHLRQLETYGTAGFKELSNGRIRYYGRPTPAGTSGEMAGARLVREWDPYTCNTRTWYETFDHLGNIRSVRPQMGGPKTHYTFDVWGNYIGTR